MADKLSLANFATAPVPQILWDPFGVENRYSGIGYHALHLAESLQTLGFAPRLLPTEKLLSSDWANSVAFAPNILSGLSRFKPCSLMISKYHMEKYVRSAGSGHRFVLHGLSNFNMPNTEALGPKVRRVLTVHDLIPQLVPQGVSKSLYLFMKWQMPRSLRRADAIITVSNWSKSVLEELYPEVRGRIFVIPNAILNPSHSKPESSISAYPTLLTVARSESYKRIEIIPKILQHLPETWTWDLVTDKRGLKKIQNVIGPKEKTRLRLHQALTEIELQMLFARAWIYVHPSLLEGYCLPAAQAICSGKPVVHTTSSGIDEVVGQGGVGLGAELGAKIWAETLCQVEARYPDFLRSTQRQAQSMSSWSEVAVQTLRVYGILD